MTEYRRKRGSDVWHWCRNCTRWPIYDYESVKLPRGQRPSSGELDNECRSKESAGNCQ